MTLCITGSQGLIGSATAEYFLKQGHTVVGIDNNFRATFFGKDGSTLAQKHHLQTYSNFTPYDIDIRNFTELSNVFQKYTFDAVIHCAAQPSHDKAKDFPILDFEVNAAGTLNMLENTRLHVPQAPFIFTSTNKVYGDNPNLVPLKEKKLRYDYTAQHKFGIDENMSLDHCTHSLFGVSKAAADLYVQEYGRYFGLKTTALRLGCVTGVSHASVKLHGFLSFFIKSVVKDNAYEVIGYQGKQVRDQIDASDVAFAMECIIKNPGVGQVFNMGGGLENNASILELLTMIKTEFPKPQLTFIDTPRVGDHICYISDTRKFKAAYPTWHLKKSLPDIVNELLEHEKKARLHT